MEPTDLIGPTLDSFDTIGNKIANSEVFDRTDIYDSQQFLEYKRGKIDKDYETWQEDVTNSLYSKAGLEDSYQKKMDRLSDAQHSYTAGETKYSADSAAQQENTRLQQLRAELENRAASETKKDFQRQREFVDQNYAQQVQAANQVENGRTFQSQGFKSQAEADAFALHMKDVASAIHTPEADKLSLARAAQMQSGQGRLDALNQMAGGDETGAARTVLENQLDSEQLTIDPNDKERLKQFGLIRQKSLANFYAAASRQEKLQATQSSDRIAALGEEAKEAELEGEGKTGEARIAALKFQTEQRVKSLQEQADAEGDSTKRSQLQKEVAAAAEAGKTERDALQKELQRQNIQAPALGAGSTSLSGAGHGGSSHGEWPNNFADVSKRLDDAATKLDRAISKLKTLAVLKD